MSSTMLNRMVPKRLLGKTGYEVSSLGIGGCTIGHIYAEHDAPTHSESFEMVKCALDRGVNIIDTAPLYGFRKSEDELGKILNNLHTEKIHERNSYHLCTKIGRYHWKEFDYSVQKTGASIEESLNRLQTDYIDIIHVHDFELTDNGLKEIYNRLLFFTGQTLDRFQKRDKRFLLDCLSKFGDKTLNGSNKPTPYRIL